MKLASAVTTALLTGGIIAASAAPRTFPSSAGNLSVA